MGEILKLLKRYDEALAAYVDSFHYELDNVNKVDIHRERGALLALLKRHDEAIEAYLDQAEACGRAWLDAREPYEQIVQLTPTSVYSWKRKARACEYLQLYNEAVMAYQQALKQVNDISEKADIYLSIGSLLKLLKRYDEAVRIYYQGVLLCPNDYRFYREKAEIFKDFKRYRQALAAYEQAIALIPHNMNFSMEKIRSEIETLKRLISSDNGMV